MEVLRGRSAAQAVVDSLGLRARLLTPRRGRPTELFSVLQVSPTADTGTLDLHPRADGAFTISRPGAAETLAVARIGITTRVAGVALALTPAARNVPDLRLQVDLPDDAIRRFQSALSVSRPARDADLIAIRTRAGDPVQAAAMANLMALNLVAERQAARRGRTAAAVPFLAEQDDTLSRQLRAAEDSLRAYQQRAHVVDAPEEARVQVGRLAQLQADVAGIRAERDALATLVKQLRWDTAGETLGGQAPSRRLMAFPSLLRNQTASVLLGALAQVEAERSQLLIRRMPADSDVQVLSRRIREIEVQLEGIAQAYLQGLTNQVASLEGEDGFRSISSISGCRVTRPETWTRSRRSAATSAGLPPRTPSSSFAPRVSPIISAASFSEKGTIRNETSRKTSTRVPPMPNITAWPNWRSRVTPTMISSPGAAMALTRTPPDRAPSRRTTPSRSRKAFRTPASSFTFRMTPPTSLLCVTSREFIFTATG